MAWAEPRYTKERVNAAGKALVRSVYRTPAEWTAADWNKYYEDIDVINNWRGSHNYPLNTFQLNLRATSKRFETNPLVAQRIKRLFSIAHKLDRFPTMKLSQVQDLGGCRVILNNVGNINRVVTYYEKRSSMKHSLASKDDYIVNPKESGYRGVHLVYRYFSDKKKAIYNGMKIELQLRSKFQHAWATAVETVGMFSGQALKSSLGSEDWQRFFSLMGSVIAIREGTPLVPHTPTHIPSLVAELRNYSDTLQVARKLQEYGNALHSISTATKGDYYYLLELDPNLGSLKVTGFTQSEADQAADKYAEAEQLLKNKSGADAVLVSVDSVNALAKAYPNYFADTRVFVELLSQALAGRTRAIRPQQLKIDFSPTGGM